MPKSRRKSDWYHAERYPMGRTMDHPSLIHHNGRTFDISEYHSLSFGGDFKMHGPFYEVKERAIFDHFIHERTLVRGLRSREAAERFIEKLQPMKRKAEARSARAERIRWIGEVGIPIEEGRVEKHRRIASRKFFTRNRDGKRVKKTDEVVEKQAEALTEGRKKLRQLKTDLRRAIKAQAA